MKKVEERKVDGGKWRRDSPFLLFGKGRYWKEGDRERNGMEERGKGRDSKFGVPIPLNIFFVILQKLVTIRDGKKIDFMTKITLQMQKS